MSNLLKRILCLLLALVLTGSMLPTVFATEAVEESHVLTDQDYASADAIFAQIDQMEDAPATRGATNAEIADKAAALVMASDSYVDGSLERNGNCFTWWTTDGIHCIYNPRMREIQNNMVAPEDPIADGIYNEPVATKGGWPSSKEVYLIGPYYGIDGDFTNQYRDEAERIAAAIGDTDGYTLYSGTAATIDKVAEAMSNGAVVIFDSHGTTDYDDGNYDYVTGANNSYLCLESSSGMTEEDQQDGALYGGGYAYINGATIANHMTKNSPGGILWMAICLGMATDTLCQPLRDMGVEVVYGYSQSISFDGDYIWEEIFWENMCSGTTVATAIADMKNKAGEWDCCTKMYNYAGWSPDQYGPVTMAEALDNYFAFPIVVSDEDTHPGQRTNSSYGADSLQTVKSTYTLYSQYEITAQSNNTAYGTVSVSGNTITAQPATGYFAQSATVISGSATVTQNGNSFSVNAQSDCTVQIHFAPKTAVTVAFSGADVSSQNGYSGDSMALPTAPAPDGYQFLGWMDAPLSADTTEKPTFYTTSFIPTGSTTLYALYSYVDESTTTGSGDYIKVTETPDDWSGEYLIVYESGSKIFKGSLSEYDATDNNISVTISKNTISAEAGDPYKFIIAPYGNGYSIQGTSGNYIGNSSNSNDLETDASAMVNKLSLDTKGNANIIGNGGAYLRYNNTSGQNRFRYYKSSSYSNQQPIALYVKDGVKGTTYYTTSIVKCEHTNTTAIAAVPATCTTDGYTAGVQCMDCHVFISGHAVITATGHKYESVETPPTATEQGYTTHTCATCGHSYVDSITDPLGQTYTVSFSVPAGVTPIEAMLCGKNGIVLPTAGVPAGEHAYTFEGWVTQQTELTEAAPEIYPAGEKINTNGNITLYALYSYTEGGSGGSGDYVKVTETPTDWSGEYLIVYEANSYIFDSSLSKLDSANNFKKVTISNKTIAAKDGDPYKFTISAYGNGYSIQGANGYYIGRSSNTNGLDANASAMVNTLSLDTEGNANIIGNGGAYLRYNNASDQNRFRYYKTSSYAAQKAICLYVKDGGKGTTYYTTQFGTVAAAVYGGEYQVGLYQTMEEAYAACESGYYVKLMADSEISLTLTKDLVLDLNGFTLTGTMNPGSYAIYGIDSATDDYDNADQGLLSCAGIGDQLIPHLQIGTKRYMAIREENGWSFHRYYLGITHTSLSTTTTGIGYKAVFYGDSAVLAQLDSQQAFGYTLSVDGGREVSRYLTADKVVSGKAVTLRVNNFDPEKHGEKTLSAYVSVVLGNYIIKSSVQETSLRQVVESINANYTKFTETQLDAVKTMIEQHPVMLNWQIDNIVKEEETVTVPTVADPVSGTAYKFGMIQENLSDTDIYYLAGGMDGYYMATTTDPAAAIDVYIEEAANGYYLYTIIEGTKYYINMVVSGTHVNGVYQATASTVYRYDTSARTVIASINGEDYHFGTRNDKNYTTVGPCKTSYDGFYAMFYVVPKN